MASPKLRPRMGRFWERSSPDFPSHWTTHGCGGRRRGVSVGCTMVTLAPGILDRIDECRTLDRLLAAVQEGESAVVVIRGEAGIGKTSLLRYATDHAPGFLPVHVTGAEAEMELPFAGIHQLCVPAVLDHLNSLPPPQRDALTVALGLAAGDVPERFLVGLAVLGLLSAAADGRPLLCLVEDAQWLRRDIRTE
jgi:AAA ATPase domain